MESDVVAVVVVVDGGTRSSSVMSAILCDALPGRELRRDAEHDSLSSISLISSSSSFLNNNASPSRSSSATSRSLGWGNDVLVELELSEATVVMLGASKGGKSVLAVIVVVAMAVVWLWWLLV